MRQRAFRYGGDHVGIARIGQRERNAAGLCLAAGLDGAAEHVGCGGGRDGGLAQGDGGEFRACGGCSRISLRRRDVLAPRTAVDEGPLRARLTQLCARRIDLGARVRISGDDGIVLLR